MGTAQKIEIRNKIAGTFTGDASLQLPVTHISAVLGLLGGDGKLASGLVPTYLVGGMRRVGTIFTGGITTLTALKTAIDSYVTTNGGTAIGCYYQLGDNVTMTVGQWHQVSRSDDGAETEVSSVALEQNDWIIFQGGPGVEGDPYIWDVINNTYNLVVANGAAGLMSGTDKYKLDGIEDGANHYNHHTQTAINANATDNGINVIDSVTVNTEGHVTAVGTRDLSVVTTTTPGVMSAADKVQLNLVVNSTTSVRGIVQLATAGEAQTATDATKALTPATGLSLLNYNQDVSYFTTLALANSATLPDGAIAIINTGSITI